MSGIWNNSLANLQEYDLEVRPLKRSSNKEFIYKYFFFIINEKTNIKTTFQIVQITT
jgi:hypothetical protein